jgi:hypothetical protein
VGSRLGELIRTAEAGNPDTAAALFAALYQELHAIAERQLRRRGPELTSRDCRVSGLLSDLYVGISPTRSIPCRRTLPPASLAPSFPAG